MIRSTLRIRLAAPAACLLALAAACDSTSIDGPDLNNGHQAGAVFLTQENPQGAFMDALFQGRISLDDEGCLRAESAGGSRPTVIWPAGYTLHSNMGALRVKDADGDVVGVVGGRFSIGGGYGQGEFVNLSPTERELFETRCPGVVWLASRDWN